MFKEDEMDAVVARGPPRPKLWQWMQLKLKKKNKIKLDTMIILVENLASLCDFAYPNPRPTVNMQNANLPCCAQQRLVLTKLTSSCRTNFQAMHTHIGALIKYWMNTHITSTKNNFQHPNTFRNTTTLPLYLHDII